MPKTTELSLVYDTAIAVLDHRGWNQGRSVDPDTGCVCLWSAVQIGAGHRMIRTDRGTGKRSLAPTDSAPLRRGVTTARANLAVRRLQALLAPSESAGRSLVCWNDEQGRTLQEVRDLLVTASQKEKNS